MDEGKGLKFCGFVPPAVILECGQPLHMWPPEKKKEKTKKKERRSIFCHEYDLYVFFIATHWKTGKHFFGSLKVRKARCKRRHSKSTSTHAVFNEATSGVKMLANKVSSGRYLLLEPRFVPMLSPQSTEQQPKKNPPKPTLKIPCQYISLVFDLQS